MSFGFNSSIRTESEIDTPTFVGSYLRFRVGESDMLVLLLRLRVGGVVLGSGDGFRLLLREAGGDVGGEEGVLCGSGIFGSVVSGSFGLP